MRSDEELLAATRRDARAFGEFYARHERAVFRYFYRRTSDVELSADLSAECFAAALIVSPRFRPGGPPAVAWLFGIARNVLGRSAERRRVESRARAKLKMPALVLEDDTIDALERIHAGQLLENACPAHGSCCARTRPRPGSSRASAPSASSSRSRATRAAAAGAGTRSRTSVAR